MSEVWGAALAAGATYYGSKESAKDQSRNTQEPAWLQEAQQFATNRGKEIADRPYQRFGGQRVAGLSRGEQRASELAQFGSEESKGYYKQAGEKISALRSFDEADLNPYMNPYTDAVLQPQLREANRAYESERTRLLNSKAGAWGGDRVAFESSELGRRHGELITDITAKAHSDAFDRATQLWSQDQDRQLRTADALRAVGGDVSRLNTQQIQDLMMTGGLDRLLKQAELDFDYQQFIENRDWSVANLQPLLQAIAASKGGNVTTTQSDGGAGAFGQALGAGISVLGMFYPKDKDEDED